MNFEKQENQTILIKEKGVINQVYVKDIMYIKADGYISTIYLNKPYSITISKCLKDILYELSIFCFFRIHRNTVINIKYQGKLILF